MLVSNCEALHYGLYGAGEGEILPNSGWSKEYADIENEDGFEGWHPQVSGGWR
jgi:hypothetical protein